MVDLDCWLELVRLGVCGREVVEMVRGNVVNRKVEVME